MDARQIADDNLLFMALSGSHAYGMNTATSDKDFRGIFYAPKEVALSAFFNVEQVEEYHEKDSVVYELKKYVKLLVDQNPNIIELLWVDPQFILHTTGPLRTLSNHREALLSSKAKFTFSGYAFSQLKRIKGHNKWINNPQPKRRPKEIDFVSVVWNDTENMDWNRRVPFEGFEAFSFRS
jgi:predicted nucleotidyltransferase